MQDAVILLIIVAAIIFGLRGTIKHMKGEGGCCGKTSAKPQKKKLKGKIVHTYVFNIEGMHCSNCANAVTRIINDIDGACAKVNLKTKKAVVKCDREVDTDVITKNLEYRGYKATIQKEK